MQWILLKSIINNKNNNLLTISLLYSDSTNAQCLWHIHGPIFGKLIFYNENLR